MLPAQGMSPGPCYLSTCQVHTQPYPPARCVSTPGKPMPAMPASTAAFKSLGAVTSVSTFVVHQAQW